MNFVLVPDAVTANYVRDKLASLSIQNTKVGNFQALLVMLQELWLLPDSEKNFSNEIEHAALKIQDAFWSHSIRVDEPNVVRLLENTASKIFDLSHIDQLPASIENPQNRAHRYFNDVLKLIELADVKPQEIELASSWIQTPYDESLADLNLYFDETLFAFKPWQQDVVTRLIEYRKEDEAFSQLINSVFDSLKEQGAEDYVGLSQRIFSAVEPVAVPDTFTGIVSRDKALESQLVANRIRTLLKEGESAEQIAIIYPADSDMPLWLKGAMDAVGIPVSNLPHDEVVRDWQKQLLRDLIRLQIDNPPPMAYRSVLSNPLMPWSSSKQLNRILELDSKSESYADEIHEGLYSPIFEKVTDVKDLHSWLEKIGESLKTIPMFNLTHQHWQSLMEQVTTWIELFNGQDFESVCFSLLSQLRSSILTVSSEKTFYLNAVLAVSSNERLPKTFKHVFVVGFNEGHYRYHLQQPIENTLLDMALCEQFDADGILHGQLELQRDILKFNLSKIKHSLTVTASNQALDGSKLELSETALDLALCFQSASKVEPTMLFVKPRELPDGFLRWKDEPIEMAARLVIDDLRFEIDLLELHKDAQGNQRSESPSSLEKMMVSPLDWLLNRQGLDDQSWEIQTLDVLIQGQIAHKVFEHYKDHQHTVLDEALFDQLFERALSTEAPFILQPSWRLERTHLRQEVKKALEAVIPWLKQEQWKIEEVEKRLEGVLWDIPLKGFADAILRKNDEVMILDYKKSKSDKRLKRLEEGFDLQTFIYRALYEQQTGNNKLHSGYYTLNDQTLVLDQNASVNQTDIKIKVPTGITLQEQSKLATDYIQQRLEELSGGRVVLNRSGDKEAWDKVGVAAYALKDNSIVQRFVIEEEV